MNDVLKLITFYNQIHNSKHFFTNGGCYLFYLILKNYYKEAQPYYNQDHVVTLINGRFYDITGEVTDKNYLPLTEEKDIKFFEYKGKI